MESWGWLSSVSVQARAPHVPLVVLHGATCAAFHGEGEAAARNVLRPQQHAELGRTGVFPAAGNCTGESQFE